MVVDYVGSQAGLTGLCRRAVPESCLPWRPMTSPRPNRQNHLMAESFAGFQNGVFLPKLEMDRPHIEFRGSEVDIVGMRNRHDADIHGVFEINGFQFLLGLAQTVGDEGFAKPVLESDVSGVTRRQRVHQSGHPAKPATGPQIMRKFF
jgi:hypothetical protein